MAKEKLDIGRRAYARELTAKEAAEQNGAAAQTICLYAREHRKPIGVDSLPKGVEGVEPSKDYGSMTKEEPIDELMLKDIEAARAKKGMP